MSDFLNFLVDVLKFLGIVLAIFIIVIAFIAFTVKTDSEMKKRECYEIYATDGVILKKCEKFFDTKTKD